MINIFTKILTAIFGLIGFFFYAKSQGSKNERNKASSLILDDIVSAKKGDNDSDSLTDNQIDSRLRLAAKAKRRAKD